MKPALRVQERRKRRLVIFNAPHPPHRLHPRRRHRPGGHQRRPRSAGRRRRARRRLHADHRPLRLGLRLVPQARRASCRPTALAWLRTADAIYFGAVGDPDIPDHVTLWGLRLPICQGLDQYANVRPTRILPGITSPLRDVGPGDLDWVIVRENSEGEYAGHGGRAHRGLPEEVATETAIFTRRGVERIMRFAFDIARSRPRKQLTVVTKSNAQRHGMVFWDEIAAWCRTTTPT